MTSAQARLRETDDAAPLLEIRDLVVEFETQGGTVRAVDMLSCHVREGETVAILGESGSGKSQTCLAVMGLLPKPAGRIASGQVRLRGQDLTTLPNRAVRRLRGEVVSVVFQDPLSALNPVLSVGSQIAEPMRRRQGLTRRQARSKAVDLMKSVRIPDAEQRVDDYPHQLSGGMRQRVVIAMALALEPALIIADEPTTALDVTVQKQIMQLLRDLQHRRRMGLVLVSHDLGVVADAAERVIRSWAAEMRGRWPGREFRIYRQSEEGEVTIRFHVVRPGLPDWCVNGIEVIVVGSPDAEPGSATNGGGKLASPGA